MNKPMPQLTRLEVEQFNDQVDREVIDHWIWGGQIVTKRTRRTTPATYGTMHIKGVPYYAHRIAYFLATGVDPGVLCVCHRCDFGLCCNPAHLFLGTSADNTADMVAKGRQAHTQVFGEANHNAKLSDDAVRQIRASTKNNVELSREFGVSAVIVGMVKSRKRWTHVA
jgi:hypothetical protein